MYICSVNILAASPVLLWTVVLLLARAAMWLATAAGAKQSSARCALQYTDAVVVILASLRWDVKFVVTTIDAIINPAMAVQIDRCTPTVSVVNV